MGRVRLYGPMVGEGSFAQVTRGMERALIAAGEHAGTCSRTDDDGEAQAPGFDAPISLNCGNPTGLMVAHRLGSHRSHWLLLAPNGEVLPQGLVASITEPSNVLPHGLLTGGLVAPCGWAAGVLRRAFPNTAVVVAPHGVMPEIHRVNRAARDAARTAYRLGQFNVLHMTSSETERKGTALLLRAWKQAKREHLLPAAAKLFVMMNPLFMSRIRWMAADLGLTDEDLMAAPGLTHDQNGVAALYGAMHAVCQPSRGEGFGLCPLEALACGVPVIATACTGHSEFLGSRPPGATIVEHGEVATMDDFAGSMAPTVTQSAIVEALAVTFTYWESTAAHAEQNAAAVAAEWAWENKTLPGIRRMIQESK